MKDSTHKSEPSQIFGPVTRRQTLITLSGLIGGGLFASSVYADLVKTLLGNSGRSLIDKTVSPASSAILADNGADTYKMRTVGLPDHATGDFPDMRPVVHVFQIPKNPTTNYALTPLGNGFLFGVALNGVVFDQAGPYWMQKEATGWHFEVMSKLARIYLGLDLSNAHVQTTGEYHYHGRCLPLQQSLENLKKKRGDLSRMCLLGFAADGFPIYAPYGPSDPRDLGSPVIPLVSSYQLRKGSRPATGPGRLLADGKTRDYTYDGTFVQDHVYVAGSGDLDECNGRSGVTDEYPDGTYYYVATDTFPFLPRFFRGTPNQSFFIAGRSGDTAPVPPELTALFG